MSTYELPDGFQSMETAPLYQMVNVVRVNGNYGIDISPFKPSVIGWSPIVPPKKKRRFVVKEFAGGCGPYVIHDDVNIYRIAERLPTRESAQAVADIYEQAYEGGV